MNKHTPTTHMLRIAYQEGCVVTWEFVNDLVKVNKDIEQVRQIAKMILAKEEHELSHLKKVLNNE